MTSKPTTSSELRDVLLYVVIAVVLVAGVIWVAQYDFDHHIDSDTQWRYLSAGVLTCFVFGFLIRNNRELWRLPRAWILWLLFLGGHLFGWSRYMLVQAPGRVPIGFYAIVSFAEIAAFSTLTAFVFGRLPRKP